MPEAQHDKLEKIADRKGLTGKRKDAFIYGIMRKTGWKPKREVDKSKTNMSARTTRIIQLNERLKKDVIEFKKIIRPDGTVVDDDPYSSHPILKTGVQAAGVSTTGAAGLYGVGALAQDVKPSNLLNKVRYDYGMGGVSGLAKTVGTGAGRVSNYAKGVGRAAASGYASRAAGAQGLSLGGKGIGETLANILKRVRGVKFSSNDRLIRLNSRIKEVIKLDEP